MKILILNSLLRTVEKKVIPSVDSIKDCMIYNLCLGFKHLGHEVTLIATEEFRPSKTEEYDFEVIFQKTSLKKLFRVEMLPLQLGLIKYLSKNKKNFDLIISSEVFAMPSLFAAMISPRNTIIWHEVNVFPKIYKKIPAKIWYHVIARLFFQKSLIVPRSIDAGNFIKRFTKHVSDTIVEHGVNLDNFVCSHEKKNQFIVVSQLVPRKNIESIVEKFHDFIHKYNRPDFKLLLVGRGSSEDSLREQIKSLNLEDNVELTGFKSHAEVGVLMSQSAAMLINTRQDLNMVSIPEAIVSGTPVITNTIPTTAPYINENELGIAKDDWDADDLHYFLENKEKFIDSCIQQRDKLSIEHSAQLLIDNYYLFKK